VTGRPSGAPDVHDHEHMGGRRPPGEPEILVLPDADAAEIVAAERIAAALGVATADGHEAHWATTGGSTPAGIYRALREPPLRDRVAWERVQLWLGDDRFVARHDPLCNVRIADEILLSMGGVPIPDDHVHPVPTDEAVAAGLGADWAAARYGEAVATLVPPAPDGWPAFDLVVVGVGPDGHLLSVFPGSAALDSRAIAIAIPAPTHIEPKVERVTLNPTILDDARVLLAVVTGGAKAPVIAQVFGPLEDQRRWPAQRARRAGATWILDAAAAAQLPGRAP
jgi:6-phosphogluconolactonase